MTDHNVFEKIREIDHIVLQHVQEGRNDVHQVTQSTHHDTKKIGYSFDKLHKHGLLNVERPDGMVEKIVNNQKRKFKAPKTAQLTDLGQRYLDQAEPVDLERYEDMTRPEIIQKLIKLEDQIDELEEKLEIYRKQLQKRLD